MVYNTRVQSANQMPTLYIIKRSGRQDFFAPEKIRNAIKKANAQETRQKNKLTEEEIEKIVSDVTTDAYRAGRALSVEEVQEKVLEGIFDAGRKSVYDLYRDYRNLHADARRKEGIFAKVEGVVEVGKQDDGSVSGGNEEVKQENANKNPTVLSVQRDYIAGELSREYTRKYLLPGDIAKAHDEGIIHFHDADYFIQHSHNCCLVNLEDMLQNGTMISGTRIDPPKSFSTACTVASQIAAQVSSSQYGGQTITLSHLAPFVDVSRQKIKKRLAKELLDAGVEVSDDRMGKIVEKELLKEIESGCQTIQYQLITLQTTNGQAPFITIFMYLHEVPEGQTREDLALLIRVMLEQRILGVKNRAGAYISPTFPKLIYVLQEDNITEGSKYWDLTVLAAKCTAKRLVPDYISEKVMKELKGDVYPCMGCRSFLTPDRFTDAGVGNIENRGNYREGEHRYYGRLTRHI